MISLIIVCKGIPYFINTAADSVLAQTRQPDEVIFVIDGPQDDTEELIRKRIKEVGYPIPHKIITVSSNQGTAEGRNAGIMACHPETKYICFLDGDDWLMPNRINDGIFILDDWNETRMKINGKPVKASFSNFFHLDIRGKFERASSRSGAYKDLLHGCFVRPNFIVMAEVFQEIGLFNPAFPQAEDYDFWERYLRVYDIAFNPEPLFVYRRHLKAKVGSEDGYIKANKERAIIQERVRRYLDES